MTPEVHFAFRKVFFNENYNKRFDCMSAAVMCTLILTCFIPGDSLMYVCCTVHYHEQ